MPNHAPTVRSLPLCHCSLSLLLLLLTTAPHLLFPSASADAAAKTGHSESTSQHWGPTTQPSQLSQPKPTYRQRYLAYCSGSPLFCFLFPLQHRHIRFFSQALTPHTKKRLLTQSSGFLSSSSNYPNFLFTLSYYRAHAFYIVLLPGYSWCSSSTFVAMAV